MSKTAWFIVVVVGIVLLAFCMIERRRGNPSAPAEYNLTLDEGQPGDTALICLPDGSDSIYGTTYVGVPYEIDRLVVVVDSLGQRAATEQVIVTWKGADGRKHYNPFGPDFVLGVKAGPNHSDKKRPGFESVSYSQLTAALKPD